MIACAVLLACLVPQAPARAPAALQPTVYTSPARRWTLAVDPAERSGLGAAEYVWSADGAEQRRLSLPFALRGAAVADDGRVAGFTYDRDPRSSDSKLRVVLLSSAGQLLADEAYARDNGGNSRAAVLPTALDVFLQPELQRFVVRGLERVPGAGPGPGGREAAVCWLHDLSTGTRSGSHALRAEPLVNGDQQVLDVEPVPGTPLLLVAWARTDFSVKPWARGALFQLVDADWDPVWNLSLPHDHELAGDPGAERALQEELSAHSPILATASGLATGSGRFELRIVADHKRAVFAVEREEGGPWRVSELERVPNLRPAEPRFSVLTPRLLRRVELAADAAHPLGVPVRARIDSTFGRVLCQDNGCGTHVFDAEGRGLLVGVPSSKKGLGTPSELFTTRDGRAWVAATPVARSHARYASSGAGEGWVQLGAANAAPLAHGDGYWGVLDEALVRCGGDHKVELRVERSPNGRWLRVIEELAVSREGGVAALESDGRAPGAMPSLIAPALLTYGPQGEPRAAFPLALDTAAGTLAYQGGRVLLADGRQGWLLDPRAPREGALQRIDLGDARPVRADAAWGLSPSGDELWVLDPGELTLLCFALAP